MVEGLQHNAAEDGIVITGPTATGKSALAVAVARACDGEIISMDSRQIYRGMDIGTAKPTVTERGGVPHHGFDLLSPAERYSAGRFARDARRWITAIRRRGRTPILAGGTGFFLKALLAPLFDEPPMPATRREALKRLLDGWPVEDLQRWAQALDPAAAARGGGRQRYARAIEIALLSGRTLGWWHDQAPAGTAPPRLRCYVLELPRDMLYRRIDERVTRMVEAGLVAEVRALLADGYTADDPGMNATGYSELIPYLHGYYDLDEAIDRIRRATRQYARRQITWFRHQLPPDTQRLDARRPVAELVREIVRPRAAPERGGPS